VLATFLLCTYERIQTCGATSMTGAATAEAANVTQRERTPFAAAILMMIWIAGLL